MNLALIVLWALSGWCANEQIRRSLRMREVEPPVPRPNWLAPRIIGAVTGIMGGWLYTQAFGPWPQPWSSALSAAASALGAVVAARVVIDIYARFSGGEET